MKILHWVPALLLCCAGGMAQSTNNPLILTPAPAQSPRINGARVLGVHPDSPVLFKIAATGQKPLRYEIGSLPDGLRLDEATGILTGTLSKPGEYRLRVEVSNAAGRSERILELKVGDTLSLTPPMGWNSWNAFGLDVTQDKVKATAQAMIDKGLVDHGWTYVNVDDGWQADKRAADGSLPGSEKFPDPKGLADWLHQRGLKFGIYSSPGPMTCGGHPGSYQHERRDAATYVSWDVDYLKYDLCSYKRDIFDKQPDKSEAAWIRPFLTMRKALDEHQRDVVYSICSFNSTPWAEKAGANLTRLTADIRDTWQGLLTCGFGIAKYSGFSRPGLWGDPDMLVVGSSGGWEHKYRPTRLTPDEQYTHISLWSLLSSPLLLGCDVEKMDDFTLGLLTNDEVIDVDQDPLGKQACQIAKNDDYQVWVKQLEDGTRAVGIFNMREEPRSITVKWSDLNLSGGRVRDLWRQKDLGDFPEQFTTRIAPHGVTLVKLNLHPGA